MQTRFSPEFLQTRMGREADKILRSCVHCGFCNATCPTYQLLGDELDGPRGRIYLIKQLLEGQLDANAGLKTQQHLDRCLQCLNCETTCPSGVQYHHLLEIGQQQLQQKQLPQTLKKRLLRGFLLHLVAHRQRFAALVRLGQWLKPLLPQSIARAIPEKSATTPPAIASSPQQHGRRVILLQGCVHRSIRIEIEHQSRYLLQKLGIETIVCESAGCCGALPYHLQAKQQTRDFIIRNINAWWPEIEQGCEAIISNASGCGLMLKDYARVLATCDNVSDKDLQRAEKIVSLVQDIGAFLSTQDLSSLQLKQPQQHIAFHPPCTLQHGLQLAKVVEHLLQQHKAKLCLVKDSHLCCGSAGSYSFFHPQIANQLRDNKLAALTAQQPDVIATANIGCLQHLQAKSDIPVVHWIELYR